MLPQSNHAQAGDRSEEESLSSLSIHNGDDTDDDENGSNELSLKTSKVDCNHPESPESCSLEKTPSTDFSSHFVVRRTDKMFSELKEVLVLEKAAALKLEEESTAGEESDSDESLPHFCGCGRPSADRNHRMIPLESIGNHVYKHRPVTAQYPNSENQGACALPIETRNSAESLPNKHRQARGGIVHPFAKPFNAMVIDTRTKYLAVPESPLDSSYQPVSSYCRRRLANEASVAVATNSSPSSSSATPYEAVLKACSQGSPIPIDAIFGGLKELEKIGEGVYGEVYCGMFRYFGQSSWVYKLVAIEGKALVNGERQKTFMEILPEIIVSQELSKLRHGLNMCYTDGYVFMRNARVAKGRYPNELLRCWDRFNEKYESDNDKPDFKSDQLYMVLEFEFGGHDIESFQFEDARQTLSIILQVIHILAVGEYALEFEHRDLHWGNILVESWQPLHTRYLINGQTLHVPAMGVKAVVIDFTISRVKNSDNTPTFLDLHEDEEQFLGTGDHQFDIYRMMRDHNRNNWERFCPKTNIFWLHYLADKLYNKGRYNSPKGSMHMKAIRKLHELSQTLFEYESSLSFVLSPACESYKEFLKSSLIPRPTKATVTEK